MHEAEDSGLTGSGSVSEKRLQQLHKWLRDTESSTPEITWRRVGMEDYRFYAGDQDSREVMEKLEAESRPASVYNEIKPKIDMLIGTAAQAKYVPRLEPVGFEDEPLAELANGALQHWRRREGIQLADRELDCFEHTVKSGRSMLYFYIDRMNPYEPKIMTKRIPGGNFLLDPNGLEDDFSDHRFLFIDKWLDEDEIKVFWPAFEPMVKGETVGLDMPTFWNEAREKYRIVECWYRKWVNVRYYTSPLTGAVEFLPTNQFNAYVDILAKGVPVAGQEEPFRLKEPLQSIPSAHYEVHYSIFCNMYELEFGKSPYNWEGFPASLCGAYKDSDNNNWFGAVTMMKDPQKGLNTVRRQLTHLLQTLPKGLFQHETGAVLDIEEYEEHSSDPNYHMEVQKGGLEKTRFVHQPQISPLYAGLMDANSETMKSVSGIDDNLMGTQKFSREPGVTAKSKKESGFTVLYVLFHNFAKFRLRCGRILFSFMQQYVTTEQVIRVEGESGKQLMALNNQMNPQSKGFNDLSAMKFDLEVDETVETATLKQLVAGILTEFSHNNPDTIPPDIILEYADVPFTVKQRVKQTWEEGRELKQQNVEAERELEELKLATQVKVARIAAESRNKRSKSDKGD